ncbi:cytochrome c oxidase subunit II [Shimia haliotis]|uniref:Cytochrome c oxidase subunit 2 n=1 Tax=Shimia haliotis TaxID=1280847 RepID=A0A1I4G0X7_9RHOB|nr:cytochrome c oxidase subunit II [Shimia haliotis]SFL23363.1 cytochrome c oxidase subunit 2 [Shimia haliotis]
MRILSTFLGLMAAVTAIPAIAQDAETIGKPVPNGLGFQPAATELATQIHRLDTLILVIITAIVLFVTALMVWVMVRYNRRSNPNPSSFTHHSTLEIAWTVLPILILLFIGANSLPVLFNQQEIPEGEVHIKVTGYQWYWGYEYTDHEFGFESFLLEKNALAENGYNEDEYLLATDTKVVVPVGKTVVMDVTGADVIHSWTIPSFGVKQDAVPGRIAQLWFEADKEGIYFGQCSELCGKDHAYMPITVEVVSEAKYNEWLKGAIEEYAGDMSTLPTVKVAAAD